METRSKKVGTGGKPTRRLNRKCLRCGKQCLKKWCSRSCNKKAWCANEKAKRLAARKCPCGKPTERRKYCSEKCMWHFIRKRERAKPGYREKFRKFHKRWRDQNAAAIRRYVEKAKDKTKARNKRNQADPEWQAVNRKRTAAYYQKNKERIKEQNRQWYWKNKERVARVAKAYREKNKERLNRKAAEYRKAHPNAMAEWRKKNKARLKEWRRRYRSKNRELVLERDRGRNRARNARKLEAELSLLSLKIDQASKPTPDNSPPRRRKS